MLLWSCTFQSRYKIQIYPSYTIQCVFLHLFSISNRMISSIHRLANWQAGRQSKYTRKHAQKKIEPEIHLSKYAWFEWEMVVDYSLYETNLNMQKESFENTTKWDTKAKRINVVRDFRVWENKKNQMRRITTVDIWTDPAHANKINLRENIHSCMRNVNLVVFTLLYYTQWAKSVNFIDTKIKIWNQKQSP